MNIDDGVVSRYVHDVDLLHRALELLSKSAVPVRSESSPDLRGDSVSSSYLLLILIQLGFHLF